MNKKYSILIHLLLFISLFANAFLAIDFFTKKQVLPDRNTTQSKNDSIRELERKPGLVPKNHGNSSVLSSVYVMPHPPDFLIGKTVYYNEYKTRNINGKKMVVFIRNGDSKRHETIVDEEAIRWK